MTLDGAAKAGVRIIVWCKACQHHIEPDLAEMVARFVSRSRSRTAGPQMA
jgi:hypothetical protein